MPVDAKTPLPPGDSELPLVGGTLRFLKDGFHFLEEGARKHGPVFQTSLFGNHTAVFTGAEAAGAFIDPAHVQRHGSVPPHLAELLFGKIGVPTLDGEAHADRKRFILAAFSREALARYLPRLQALIAQAFARWATKPEVRLVEELRGLALQLICSSIMGIESEATLAQLQREYAQVIAGATSLPVPIPGLPFAKGRGALARIFALFGEAVREHQASPGKFDDGLSRMLAAKTEAGKSLTAEEATVELHHLVIAGLVVWAWLAASVIELDKNAAVRERLLAELGKAPALLTVEALHEMKYLEQLSMEVRRTTPVIHVVFGKAKETFEFAGRRIPAGWNLVWGVNSSHRDRATYTEPAKFDPDRFAPPRNEQARHEHAFAPQGAGAPTFHKCAGWELAPLLLKLFMAELLRHQVKLPPQELALDWKKIPPEPRDGLRASIR